MIMPRIPSIKKLSGDDEVSFSLWLLQFEAQLGALGINADQNKQMLLCCLEGSAFSYATQQIGTNNLAYNDLKNVLVERFTGEDYKRKLETKLRNLKFMKGTNINLFAHTLRNTIKELYGLQGNANDAIDAIAINHVVSGLSEEIRSQTKILQLTGNKSLECLLELVEDKLSGNMLFVNSSTVHDKNNVSKVESDRITKLEQMFETLLKWVDNMGESKCKQTCGYCGKANHVEGSCFKLKTYFKCNSKGHIAKCCKQNNSETASLRLGTANGYDRQKKNLIPAERLLLKIKVCEKLYEFLHDTGSQFSIIKRSIYDGLPNKPPLHEVTQCGIGIEGSKFIFDGVVYLNLGLQTAEGHTYNLEYEPVFVSSQISTNIYGMKTEERFKSCLKDHENLTLVCSPRVGDENITIK